MEELAEKFRKKVILVPSSPIRNFAEQIDWRDRMIGILVSRD